MKRLYRPNGLVSKLFLIFLNNFRMFLNYYCMVKEKKIKKAKKEKNRI